MGFPSTVGKGLGGRCRAEQSLSQILFQFSVCQWCVLGHFGTLLDINIHYYFFCVFTDAGDSSRDLRKLSWSEIGSKEQKVGALGPCNSFRRLSAYARTT